MKAQLVLLSLASATVFPKNGSTIPLHLSDPIGLLVLPLTSSNGSSLTKFDCNAHNTSVIAPSSCSVSANATDALVHPTAVDVGTASLDLTLIYGDGAVNVTYEYFFVVDSSSNDGTTAPADVGGEEVLIS